jgi:hypothetical protein
VFDDVVGSRCRGLGEDDGAVDPGGDGAGHQHHGLRNGMGCTTSQARGG